MLVSISKKKKNTNESRHGLCLKRVLILSISKFYY